MKQNEKESSNTANTAQAFNVIKSNKSVQLPHAIELEETVLGAIMMEQNAIYEVIDLLTPEHFHQPAHQVIYKAIVELFNSKEGKIDPRLVVNRLRSNQMLGIAGSPAYVAKLTESIASSAHIEEHARILTEFSMRRKLIRIGNGLVEQAADLSLDAFEIVDKAQADTISISDIAFNGENNCLQSVMSEYLNELREAKSNKISTGYHDLDSIIGGWKKGEFVVLGARPGLGKTALLLNFALKAAVGKNVACAFFSVEMSKSLLCSRIASILSEIPSDQMKEDMHEDKWEKIFKTTCDYWPLFLNDKAAIPMSEIRTQCRRLKKEHDIRLVFVDYLQLVTETTIKNGNREQQVAAISRALKQMAKDLDITVIVAVQLNRLIEQQGEKKTPALHHIRESGSIEQDADIIMFLHRPEFYGVKEDEDGRDAKNLAKVIVGKNRNGKTGICNLTYNRDIQTFFDYKDAIYDEFFNDL